MAQVWITYAWNDNQHGDVDYIAQELGNAGLTVKLDRWNIGAGGRLWEQIESFIAKPEESDAWLLVATQASLSSEPCKEEFAYALDRALRTRGAEFPVMALFPGTVDPGLIPAGIRTRLYVSLTDPDWKERIKSAAEGREPQVTRTAVQSYALTVHRGHPSGKKILEARPRAGVWAPVFAAIPVAEQAACKAWIMVESSGVVTGTGMVSTLFEGTSQDGAWWMTVIQAQATPTQSLYVWLEQVPSRLRFGVPNGGQQFEIPSSAWGTSL